MKANPVASFERDTSGNVNDYTLQCQFSTEKYNFSLQAHVEWFIGDEVVDKSVVMTIPDEETYKPQIDRQLLTKLAYGSEVRLFVHLFVKVFRQWFFSAFIIFIITGHRSLL